MFFWVVNYFWNGFFLSNASCGIFGRARLFLPCGIMYMCILQSKKKRWTCKRWGGVIQPHIIERRNLSISCFFCHWFFGVFVSLLPLKKACRCVGADRGWGSTRPLLCLPPYGCHPLPAINQVRTKVNPHGHATPMESATPHWCATPMMCHPPLMCHSLPAHRGAWQWLAVVHGGREVLGLCGQVPFFSLRPHRLRHTTRTLFNTWIVEQVFSHICHWARLGSRILGQGGLDLKNWCFFPWQMVESFLDRAQLQTEMALWSHVCVSSLSSWCCEVHWPQRPLLCT